MKLNEAIYRVLEDHETDIGRLIKLLQWVLFALILLIAGFLIPNRSVSPAQILIVYSRTFLLTLWQTLHQTRG